MRKLILRSFQSPGDIMMLTAAIRDLHAGHTGKFQTDVRTSADALWENNPHITRLHESELGVEVMDMHYGLIHQSNDRPYHFIHGYVQHLEKQLGLQIPITRFQGDIHLTADEKQMPPPAAESGIGAVFWIIMAGGKFDFTAKWWNPAFFQAVVDYFRGKIQFVQCGEAGHWHPKLNGVIDLIGKTTTREFVRLMYHASGVVCPVTFAMHLAAAVPTKPGRFRHRPCVVIAGGREPAQWEAYPHHQFLSTNGLLRCCQHGGCWKSRCQKVGDGDAKDREGLCEQPVDVGNNLVIAKCLHMIKPEDVIRRIELCYEGGAVEYLQPTNGSAEHPATAPVTTFHPASPDRTTAAASMVPSTAPVQPSQPNPACPTPAKIASRISILIEFRHGLGDAVQLTIVLLHLRHFHPDWDVDVAALRGKHSAYHGLCRRGFVLDHDPVSRAAYNKVYPLEWHECRSAHAEYPSTKPTRALLEEFGLTPLPELCQYSIQCGEGAIGRARAYLESICPADLRPKNEATGRFPVVLIHYQGNTSEDRKNLPHELIRDVCEVVRAAGAVPVILDWDKRSPLVDGVNVHNPGADHPLWGRIGTGDAESLAALIEQSALMIGVDSGPLHVAGATSTPTIGVWTQHHPIQFFDLAKNVVHLVPGDHEKLSVGPAALAYFRQAYRHRVYKNLFVELPALVQSHLTGEDVDQIANKRFLKQLSTKVYGAQYYREHLLAGLDYLNFGEWHQQYGRWFVESLSLQNKRVLDVGCACGAILRGLGQAGAIVQGVELNEHMVQLGRTKWPDMAPLLFICDAVNLHLFGDESWDAIHTAQVAEHWKPELVPHILRELHRVTVPGGLLFCALDTEELFARQGRTIENEDPTHVCIKPMTWWHEQLVSSGWLVCTPQVEPSLRSHRESFLKRYDWDWFVAKRPAASSVPVL